MLAGGGGGHARLDVEVGHGQQLAGDRGDAVGGTGVDQQLGAEDRHALVALLKAHHALARRGDLAGEESKIGSLGSGTEERAEGIEKGTGGVLGRGGSGEVFRLGDRAVGGGAEEAEAAGVGMAREAEGAAGGALEAAEQLSVAGQGAG